jgi:hypothetical protein
MSTMRWSAPARLRAATRTLLTHRLRAVTATVVLTLSTVLVPGVTAPHGAARADAGPVTLPVTPPATTQVGPSAQARLSDLLGDQDARGGNRLVVDWGTLTPLQDRPVSVRGTAPVPSNGTSRWVYLEERVLEDGVWGYVKDTRTNALGEFALEVTLHRVNEPRRFRIVVDKGPGTPSVVSSPVTLRAVWQPDSPTTKTYPGLSVTWPGTRVLVGSRQAIQGTLASRPSRGVATLQRLVAEQWSDVASGPVTGSGSFTLSLPTAYLAHSSYRLRITGSRGEVVETPAESFVVVPDYSPGGRDTSYSFVSPDPVGRWNPCAPITYRVNTTKAPPGVLPDVRAALDQVSQATGLRFDYRGTTSVVPFLAGDTFDPAVADLVIAWADPAQMRGLFPTGTLGIGGPEFRTALAVDPAGRPVRQIYQGGVTINTAFNKALEPGSGEGLTRVAALMHEVGHAVGLMHVDGDAAQLMSPAIGYGLDQWGAGDLAGLELVGAAGGCLTPGA